jgi:hypothetical protein
MLATQVEFHALSVNQIAGIWGAGHGIRLTYPQWPTRFETPCPQAQKLVDKPKRLLSINNFA